MTEPSPQFADNAIALLDNGTADVTSERLCALLGQLGLPADEVAIRMLAGELGHDQSEFELRIGEWRLNLSVAAARALVNGAVLTAALAAKGEASIPATVLSVIVPLIFDLERITLAPSDRVVYVDLVRHAPDRKHIDDWYASLSDHIKDEISNLEFRDLIERLDDAGLVDNDLFDLVTVDPQTARRRRRLSLP